MPMPSRFDFRGKAVRAMEREGEPWFVAADVCKILKIANPTRALASLDEDEKYTLHSVKGIARDARAQELAMVNESGLYHLIFQSRKTEAKAFRRWVTSEVLPAIRKNGSYDARRIEALEMFRDVFSPRRPAGEISERTGLPKIQPIRGHFRSAAKQYVLVDARLFQPDLFGNILGVMEAE